MAKLCHPVHLIFEAKNHSSWIDTITFIQRKKFTQKKTFNLECNSNTLGYKRVTPLTLGLITTVSNLCIKLCYIKRRTVGWDEKTKGCLESNFTRFSISNKSQRKPTWTSRLLTIELESCILLRKVEFLRVEVLGYSLKTLKLLNTFLHPAYHQTPIIYGENSKKNLFYTHCRTFQSFDTMAFGIIINDNYHQLAGAHWHKPTNCPKIKVI